MNAHAVWDRGRHLGGAVHTRTRRISKRSQELRSRARHYMGYRGLILLILGSIYICIGLAVIGANDYMEDLVHTHLPVTFRVLLWIIPGAVALIVAPDHKWQAVGFGLLFIPPAERSMSFFIAALTVPPTWQRVPGALVYLLVVLMVTFMASWPEPSEVEKSITDQLEQQQIVDLSSGSDDALYIGEDGIIRSDDDDPPPAVTE